MPVVVHTAPALEPITLVEAKTHLRLDIDTDDADVSAMIVAARNQAEALTGLALYTQTLDLYLDGFPDEIVVPRPPLQSVTSIVYRDTAGNQQTLAADQYQVDVATRPGRIRPAYGCAWPSTRGTMNDVVVQYVAGFGVAAAIPADVKHALKLLVGAFYENREDFITGTIVTPIPLAAGLLLAPYRSKTVLFAA